MATARTRPHSWRRCCAPPAFRLTWRFSARGPGPDVNSDLPGMNEFDHAIVYVPPPAGGGEPLWIDATAEYSQVGTLPSMDQGRLALIIAEGTTALTPTPEARPEDDLLS